MAASGGGVYRMLPNATSPNLGPIAAGTNPKAVAFDGTKIWVASSDGVYYITSGGTPTGPITAGTNPVALAFDGSNIWVANQGSTNVTKFRAADAFNLGTFSTPGAPTGLAFDGIKVWVANGNLLSRR